MPPPMSSHVPVAVVDVLQLMSHVGEIAFGDDDAAPVRKVHVEPGHGDAPHARTESAHVGLPACTHRGLVESPAVEIDHPLFHVARFRNDVDADSLLLELTPFVGHRHPFDRSAALQDLRVNDLEAVRAIFIVDRLDVAGTLGVEISFARIAMPLDGHFLVAGRILRPDLGLGVHRTARGHHGSDHKQGNQDLPHVYSPSVGKKVEHCLTKETTYPV